MGCRHSNAVRFTDGLEQLRAASEVVFLLSAISALGLRLFKPVMPPCLLKGCVAVQSAMAGPEGGDQEAEVREDQREEDVDAHRGPLQELPVRIRLLLPLLSAAPVRRQTRLCLPEEAVQGLVHPGRCVLDLDVAAMIRCHTFGYRSRQDTFLRLLQDSVLGVVYVALALQSFCLLSCRLQGHPRPAQLPAPLVLLQGLTTSAACRVLCKSQVLLRLSQLLMVGPCSLCRLPI